MVIYLLTALCETSHLRQQPREAEDTTHPLAEMEKVPNEKHLERASPAQGLQAPMPLLSPSLSLFCTTGPKQFLEILAGRSWNGNTT